MLGVLFRRGRAGASRGPQPAGAIRLLSSSDSEELAKLSKQLEAQGDMVTQLMVAVTQLKETVVASKTAGGLGLKASAASAAPGAGPSEEELERRRRSGSLKAVAGKNPRGFIDFVRTAEPFRPAPERLNDWAEINAPGHADPVEQKRQAARCMDCGTPFCQTHTGCPVNNLIPEWNELVLNEEWREALDRLHRTNNFPEFTGRVCPAPCEGSCVAGLVDEPVTIKNIEYAIVEKGWAEGWITPRMVPAEARSGKRVAIIGSGPAGLAAADELNQLGHTAVVLEREDRIGGLLMYGIPNPKLDKRTVDRRVDLLRAEGVEFRTGADVGGNGKDIGKGKGKGKGKGSVDPKQLREDFDAVVLAVGATVPRLLDCPGAALKGVYPAMDFLTANQKDLEVDEHGSFRNKWTDEVISAEGKHVVVVGGGDTGTDCIGTSVRQYCASMRNLEIVPRKPDARGAGNAWPLYPETHKVDYGHAEAAHAFGQDPRIFATQTKQVLDDGKGNVRAVVICKVHSVDGRLEEVPGTEETIPADLVLLAMGFTGPEATLVDAFHLDTDERGNVLAKHGEYTTTEDGVFAAGDCRRGQSLVVWAINEGRGVAKAVDAFLAR